MPFNLPAFLQAAEGTFRFTYQIGDVTRLTYPHGTGWRVLPWLMTSQNLDSRARVETDAAEPFEVDAGDVVCIPPGVRHKLDKITRAPSVSRWSHVNISVLGSLSLFSIMDIPFSLTGDAAYRIGDLNEEMALLTLSGEPTLARVMRRNALGFELIAVLVDVAVPNDRGLQLAHLAPRLAPVLAFVDQNIASPLPRNELARLAHLSPSRFFTVFKAAIGCSPSEYVQGLRLQRAQQLLINTDLTMAEVGLRTGYEDAFHFSRMFKKQFGLSPSHYRRDVLKDLF